MNKRQPNTQDVGGPFSLTLKAVFAMFRPQERAPDSQTLRKVDADVDRDALQAGWDGKDRGRETARKPALFSGLP
jgi:hypothetical protein